MPIAAVLVILGLWLAWIGGSGGYSSELWLPSALGMTGVWAVVAIWNQRLLPELLAVRVVLLAFAALVALNYLSIAWAASKGSALDSSNQLSLYLLVAWAVCLLPWTPYRLAAVAALWAFGAAIFCLTTLIKAWSASDLTPFFINGRFSVPLQYSNATGALAVMSMWPALILSARRELPVWLRGAMCALATFLAAYATIPQSRATLLGLLLTAPLGLAVASDRRALIARMAIVGGGLAICIPRAIHVDKAVNTGGHVAPLLHHLIAAVLLSTLGAALLGLLAAVAQQRLPAPADRPRRAVGSRRRLALLAAGAVAVLLVLLAVEWPQLVHLVHTVIRKGNTDAGVGNERLLSTSPEERFDYLRAAAHLFSSHPLLGIGSGNFGRDYDALRTFVKHSAFVHNLPMRVLCETGIVGGVIFAGMLISLVVGLVRSAARSTGLPRSCTAFAFPVAAYFFIHSCLDWVDAFPALAAPALALPLAAMLVAAPEAASHRQAAPESQPRPRARLRSAVAGSVAGGLWLVLLLALATSYLSLRYVDRAFGEFRTQPEAAYNDLHRAQKLDPLSVNPITAEGTIALYSNNELRAANAFARAARRENDWYQRVELAVLEAHAGRFDQALRQIDEAARLDVDDPVIADARASILKHARIDPLDFNSKLARENNAAAIIDEKVH